MEPATPLLPRRRLAWLLYFGWMGFLFFRDGLSVDTLISWFVLLCAAGCLWLIETCTRRPVKSYLFLALGSASLLIVVLSLGDWDGDLGIKASLWIGMTLLGMVWTVAYERIEPRP